MGSTDSLGELGLNPPELSEMPVPVASSGASSTPSVTLAADHQVFFYSSEQWEEFIRECATVLADRYVQVKRLGGTNDEGVDIAGFLTEEGFEGLWDCWQGKHYAKALTPSDAFPEIAKVLRHVVAGSYEMPNAYFFAAPKGCGNSLSKLLSKPAELRTRFLEDFEHGRPAAAGLVEAEVELIRSFANGLNFNVFRTAEMHELLGLHALSPYHQQRFGGPLKDRPEPPAAAPDEVCASESRYLEQLLGVYREKHPEDEMSLSTVAAHTQVGEHFRRQRLSFYSAESLRLYARDSVPPGTYDRLQDDIHDGVVEVAEGSHGSGMDRLRAVLTAASHTDLSGHPLITVSRIRDRHGVCHQLSNDDRLTWLSED